MKKLKKPLLFALAMMPVEALAGYFVSMYEVDMYDPEMLEPILQQLGSVEMLAVVGMVQCILYGTICAVAGWLLAEALGLRKPFRLEKEPTKLTLLLSLPLGVLLSLDLWTFGKWIPQLNAVESTRKGLTLSGWLGSVLYGGVMEELMIRYLVMGLAAFLLWKLFARRADAAPTWTLVAANILAALLFAAAHLPATVAFFGSLTPLIVFRCFLLNGSFGLFFGWLYRRHGIQYAMLSHATLHIISKLIWTLFL